MILLNYSNNSSTVTYYVKFRWKLSVYFFQPTIKTITNFYCNTVKVLWSIVDLMFAILYIYTLSKTLGIRQSFFN